MALKTKMNSFLDKIFDTRGPKVNELDANYKIRILKTADCTKTEAS